MLGLPLSRVVVNQHGDQEVRAEHPLFLEAVKLPPDPFPLDRFPHPPPERHRAVVGGRCLKVVFHVQGRKALKAGILRLETWILPCGMAYRQTDNPVPRGVGIFLRGSRRSTRFSHGKPRFQSSDPPQRRDSGKADCTDFPEPYSHGSFLHFPIP